MRLCIILVMAFPGIAGAGNVTVTLLGINPLTINIKGNSQNEEAGNISIYLYFRDDDTTDLEADNVDASQIEDTWGWGTGFLKKEIQTGTWPVGGHDFTRRLYYDNADIGEANDYWTTDGVNAIICNFTSVGSGHAYVEVNGVDGLSDWSATPHNVTYVNQDASLPVELSSFTASADDTKVTLKWETGSEVGNIGFYVYRGETTDGPFKKISNLIEGAGNSAIGRAYEFIDKKIKPAKTYFYYIEDVDVYGIRDKSDAIQVIIPLPKQPKETKIFQNFPNPFNPETWIPYQLAKEAEVVLRVYNVKGQLIRTLRLGKQSEGSYLTKERAAYWDGRNEFGEKIANGVYFCTLHAGNYTAARKMLAAK